MLLLSNRISNFTIVSYPLKFVIRFVRFSVPKTQELLYIYHIDIYLSHQH